MSDVNKYEGSVFFQKDISFSKQIFLIPWVHMFMVL